jgi:hypothetical protein
MTHFSFCTAAQPHSRTAAQPHSHQTTKTIMLRNIE